MKLLLFVIVLLYIYPTKPFFLSQFTFIILFIFLFYQGFKNHFFIKELSQKKILLIYMFLFITLVINAISMFINNNFIDFTYFLLIFKYIFVILIAISIVKSLIKYNLSSQDLIRFYIYASFILSLFCIVEFLVPEAKALMSYTFLSTDNITYDSSFRVKGFVSGGGANLSWGLASAVILSHALYFKEKTMKIFYISIVISIATILVGRTGILLMLPSWILTILMLLNFRNRNKNLLNFSLLLIIIFSIVYYVNQNEEMSRIILKYSFELFYNFIVSGEFTSSSTEHLSSMYFIPDVVPFVVGEGLYKMNDTYNAIDIGYYRQLLSTGIIGSLILYGMFIFIQIEIYKYYYLKIDKVFSFLFLTTFWIFEFKEPGFLQGYTSRLLILIYIYTLLIKMNQRKIISEKNSNTN